MTCFVVCYNNSNGVLANETPRTHFALLTMKLSASAPLALALALCALLHAPHATNAAAAELPLQITPGNIKEATAGESTVIVAFLARPAPKFESELVRLKQLTANDPSVTVAAANCAVHRRFIREYGLTIFPAIRVFPAGLNHVPFVVDFADDLVAERLQQILEHYKNAIAPLPPQYDASLEAAREYLFGAHRGNNTIQQEALVRWSVAHAVPEPCAFSHPSMSKRVALATRRCVVCFRVVELRKPGIPYHAHVSRCVCVCVCVVLRVLAALGRSSTCRT